MRAVSTVAARWNLDHRQVSLLVVVRALPRATLEQEILQLPPALMARFIRYAERMETFGPDLGMPHTRALGEGLFELRMKGPGGIARIFYCTCGGRRIVMLHQYTKKSEKAPRKELDIARRRMREVKREITDEQPP